MATRLAARIAGSWREQAVRWSLIGAALALAACFLHPGWPAERARFDHVVVLDITQSMDVTDAVLDGKPVSRLRFAQHALRAALLELPCGSKVGWAVFTEYRAFLLFEPVEVCANLTELRATLTRIDGRMAWNGNSEIAKGLHSGLVLAKALPGSPSLVFITDGQESPPLDPKQRPAFDDKPGEVAGLIVGVGDTRLSPIPKTDPSGNPLGMWRADEVLQSDPYTRAHGGGAANDGAGAPNPALGATPGSEHLSSLREPYLRLLAREQGLSFLRLDAPEALGAALTAPALAKATPVRADGRGLLAAIAFLLLLATFARVPVWAVVLASALLASGPARANDRPFQFARTAVMEDDENVWSFETWAQRLGKVRALSFEPEYTFDPANSIQVELTRRLDRRGEQTGHEVEVELKHLFNNVARDGWGWGVSAAFSAERSREEGSTRALGLKVPVSIALGDSGGLLHLNVGIDKARHARREWTAGVGIERELFKRTTVFAEWAREGELRFVQVGARHWVKRDHLAIDFSLQHQRLDGTRASGFIIGLGWYDL